MTDTPIAPERPIPAAPTHRPHERPTVAFRAVIGLLGLAAIVFNVGLMLSDRAPDFTRRVFGDFARRLSDRIDADRRSQVLGNPGLPESDAIVHIGVWGVATLLIALTLWTWRGTLLAALTVFVASVIIEFAQGRYSSSRNVEASDVMANATGVLLGSLGAGACFVAWTWTTRAANAVRNRRLDRPAGISPGD